MIRIKNLTLKNFLSIGAVTQTVDFTQPGVTLVLGENLDLGGNGTRNGVGKTSIINALSYALYGQAISNIKRDNLINTVNKKNMVVSVEFEKNGVSYRIERGRKPNFFKYKVGDTSVDVAGSDEAQGENKETQKQIEELLGLSPIMFRHIVCMNTYTEPFLNMGAGKQREIIEELLGITLLSQKADRLKELIKVTKTRIDQCEFEIQTKKTSNQRILAAMQELEQRVQKWDADHEAQIEELAQALLQLQEVDVLQEIEAHKFNQELKQHSQQARMLSETIKHKQHVISSLETEQKKVMREYELVQAHECPMCGSHMHDERQDTLKQHLTEKLHVNLTQIEQVEPELAELTRQLHDLSTQHVNWQPRVTFYDSLEAAINHKRSMEEIQRALEKALTQVNPYADQTTTLHSTLQDISYDEMNELQVLKEHQEFLLRLLTNKDSFIRKRIIDQNLSYLNHRLHEYLITLGLSHEVKFQNDLSVEINYLGQDMDFGQLSRGETTRVILALSWAFRDIWENQNSGLNILTVDELMDVGLDTSGVEKALEILKLMGRDRQKHVMLVSHREELLPRCDRTLMVVKESGFSSIQSDYDASS